RRLHLNALAALIERLVHNAPQQISDRSALLVRPLGEFVASFRLKPLIAAAADPKGFGQRIRHYQEQETAAARRIAEAENAMADLAQKEGAQNQRETSISESNCRSWTATRPQAGSNQIRHCDRSRSLQ